MSKKTILLLSGGGGSEHEISQISAKHISSGLDQQKFQVIHLEMQKDLSFIEFETKKSAIISSDSTVSLGKHTTKFNFAIPCFHGFPGETGEIAAFFEILNVPYMGQNSEISSLCFNKVSTKLWLSSLCIPNTPYFFLTNPSEIDEAAKRFEKWGDVFIKAASQGSSVGCYHVKSTSDFSHYAREAFNYSEYVLVEKTVKGRELEIAIYEYKGELVATVPGEIITSGDSFYTYEEKYAETSKTTTDIEAKDLSKEVIEEMISISKKTFKSLKLRHLSRIDFFLTTEGEVILNEINTFPGMTPISMFPKMMENNGHNFKEFLTDIINKETTNV